MNSFVAFIPVRGGSKGIPGKNIKVLAGKPLVYHVMEAAGRCESISEIVVATDDPRIADVVTAHPHVRSVVFHRSPESSTDEAPTETVLLEYARKAPHSHIVLVQATSPLLTAENLGGGIQALQQARGDSLVTVSRMKKFVWQYRKDGYAAPVNYDPTRRPRRQEFEGLLVENGAFYISERAGLLRSGCRLFGKVVAYELPEEFTLEIDEPHDWLIMEQLSHLKRRSG